MVIGRRAVVLTGVGALIAACSPQRPARTSDSTSDSTRSEYGRDPSQVGDLYLPSGESRGTVVVIHGGFWFDAYDLSLGAPLAKDLARRGWVAWNIEYRRLGNGGGWPETFEDVAAAIDHLEDLKTDHASIDLDRVITLGHSAGGHLAAWAASRAGLPADAPGAGPRVGVSGVVSQAGVLDLATAAEEQLGGGAANQLMGGSPREEPTRFELADPIQQLPSGVPVHAVHSEDDQFVPFRQSSDYVDAARAAGDDATLVRVDGDHMTLIDRSSYAWETIVESIETVRSKIG